MLTNYKLFVKARALLFPVGQTNGPPIYMTCKTLNIGTAGESDLILNCYGLCSFVSQKHTVTFFGKVRNYSITIFFFNIYIKLKFRNIESFEID